MEGYQKQPMRMVYFSFHFEDVWRVNQIRNSNIVPGARSAGFADKSIWEEAKSKNAAKLRKLIMDNLEGTAVTAVLIGTETWQRPWVKFEIAQSIKRGNALLGVHINGLKDQKGRTKSKGKVPKALSAHGAPIHTWTSAADFGRWVEAAWQTQCSQESSESGLWSWFFK